MTETKTDNSMVFRIIIAALAIGGVWMWSNGKFDNLFGPSDKNPTPDNVEVVDQDAQLKAVCIAMARHLRAGEIKHSGELLSTWRNVFRLSVYGTAPTESVAKKSRDIENALKTELELTDTEIALDATKSEKAAKVFDAYSTI